MADEKKLEGVSERTKAAIMQDYADVCAKIGHIAGQIRAFTKELDFLHDRQQDLGLENVALEAKAAPKVAEEGK